MFALKTILDRYRTSSQSEREKGTYFERLIRCYFKNEPCYEDLFTDVWSAAPRRRFSRRSLGCAFFFISRPQSLILVKYRQFIRLQSPDCFNEARRRIFPKPRRGAPWIVHRVKNEPMMNGIRVHVGQPGQIGRFIRYQRIPVLKPDLSPWCVINPV